MKQYNTQHLITLRSIFAGDATIARNNNQIDAIKALHKTIDSIDGVIAVDGKYTETLCLNSEAQAMYDNLFSDKVNSEYVVDWRQRKRKDRSF
jgi:hypothetical protein